MKSKKELLLISVVAFSIVSLFAVSQSSNVDAATTSDNYQYYKATKKVQMKVSGATKKVSIPKGTIIRGRVTQFTGYAKPSIQASFDSLSYQFRKSWPNANPVGAWALSGYTMNANDFKLTSTPKYMVTSAINDNPLGTEFYYASTKSPYTLKTYRRMVFTTDGYIERYLNKKGTMAARPYAYAKIRKVTTSGNYKYYYYRNHLKGVHDKHVHKTGNYRYRLAVKKTSKTVSVNLNSTKENFAVYSIGGVNYKTWSNDVNN